MYRGKGQHICKKSQQNFSKISAVFHSKRQAIGLKMKANVFQSIKEELLEGDLEKMEETARRICAIPDAKLFSIKELAEKDFVKLKRKT